MLGRLVSLVDFDVEAARYGGVIRAHAKFAWGAAGEDALVKVWTICADLGDPMADFEVRRRSE